MRETLIGDAQISGEFYDYTLTGMPEESYTHDYTRTLTMKLDLSIPTAEGGTKVFLNFEQALEVIRMTDHLTRQVPKIIYLVGWQFNGHDDKYPAFNQVNEALKRPQDTNARESLIWLMEEAYQYHTTVSLHINMTDAYQNSPLWETYISEGLIAHDPSGKLMAIGTWGAGQTAYQVCYKNEWESGYTVKRLEELVQLLPIPKAGTIHIDAYICRTSYESSLEEERMYRRKVIRYLRGLGIDVTTEFLYNCPGRDQGQLPDSIAKVQKDDLIGLVPMIWWLNQEPEDYVSRPRSLLCGGRYNKDLNWPKTDWLSGLVGNSIHGEDVFMAYAQGDKEWQEKFIAGFCLEMIPWYYFNQFPLKDLRGKGKQMEALYDTSLHVSKGGQQIIHQDVILRDGNDLFMPIPWANCEIVAYSEKGYEGRVWALPFIGTDTHDVALFEVTTEGLKTVGEPIKVENNQIRLTLLPRQMLLIKY